MLTDEEAAELAALRARAFGPDADIFDDPPSLARLRELEGRSHDGPRVPDTSASIPAVVESDLFDVPVSSETRVASPSSDSAPADSADDESMGSVSTGTSRRTWTRRAVLLVGVPAAVLACAAGVGIGVAASAQTAGPTPSPISTLETRYVETLNAVDALYSWDGGSARLLADLNGTLVWDGTTARGTMTCIVVVLDNGFGQVEPACAPTNSLTTSGVGLTITDPRSRATFTYVAWPDGAPVLSYSIDDPNPSP